VGVLSPSAYSVGFFLLDQCCMFKRSKKNTFQMTQKEIQHGIYSHGGKRLCSGTGLSPRTIKRALKQLKAIGLAESWRIPGSNRYEYRFHPFLEPEGQALEIALSFKKKRKTPAKKKPDYIHVYKGWGKDSRQANTE